MSPTPPAIGFAGVHVVTMYYIGFISCLIRHPATDSTGMNQHVKAQPCHPRCTSLSFPQEEGEKERRGKERCFFKRGRILESSLHTAVESSDTLASDFSHIFPLMSTSLSLSLSLSLMAKSSPWIHLLNKTLLAVLGSAGQCRSPTHYCYTPNSVLIVSI